VKLDDFFAAIAPYLEGKQGHDEAARKLFGEQDSADAQRLALYGRFCRGHRFNALASTFSETRAALIRHAGEEIWDGLVEAYFRAHPMHHVELNENGSDLPAYLTAQASSRALPAWLPELADLEWWSFRTRVAPDDSRDANPDEGPLRLAATVELRPYAHDLASWLSLINDDEADPDDLPVPEARPVVVLFWRDRDLDTRNAEANSLELNILHALFEQRPLESAAARVGASAQDLEETIADLLGAGILFGARSPSQPLPNPDSNSSPKSNAN
jgi:hypothetical protein